MNLFHHITCSILTYYFILLHLVILPSKADCIFTYSAVRGEIQANSVDLESQGHTNCRYRIKVPKQYNIQLNFTHISGFFVNSNETKSDSFCLPQIFIKSRMKGESVKSDLTICRQNNNSNTPHIYISESDSIVLVFTWKLGHPSSFHIHYQSLYKNKCELDSSSSNINCLNQRSSPSTGTEGLIKTIVIVVCVAIFLALAVVICIVMRTQCQLVSRSWHTHNNREGPIRPQSQSSEVFVSTPSSREQMEQQEALLRERYIQVSSTQRDGELGYPPQIPISRDGEEGYAESQKQLANQRNLESLDSRQYFRPPPNRTIFDRKQSPPPYPYTSASSLDTSCGRTCNGYSTVIRCHSLSINSYRSDSIKQSSATHSRTSSMSEAFSDGGRASTEQENCNPSRTGRIYQGAGSPSLPDPQHVNVYNTKHLDRM